MNRLFTNYSFMKNLTGHLIISILLLQSLIINAGSECKLLHLIIQSDNKVLSDTLNPNIGKGKVVGLDNFYNNEWKKDKNGNLIPFHYLWNDREASGFSDLGVIINNLGAKTVELKNAPTIKDLNELSIYFIVDPDTPAETEHPNYLQEKEIDEIVKWVKKGGVLVLFGNDINNAEFEHWNMLSKNFGIVFKKNCENKVDGTNWNMGKFDNLPDHPVFKNVRKIYLKEISTLKIEDPVSPVLTSNNKVIMASAKSGKGFVFAVGDPWIYNEYIAHSRLSDDFDNYKAAVNLFSWLLQISRPVK